MKRSSWGKQHNRLRRVGVYTDKSLQSIKACKTIAEQLVRESNGFREMQDIVVYDHSHAPSGSYGLGDEIALTTAEGWLPAQTEWYRILGITLDPEAGNSRLSIMRADKV